MTKMMRLAVLAAGLLSLCGALTASAGAVTWHNSGATAFTATTGAATLSSTGVNLSCTSSNGTGTVPASFVGTTLSSGGTASFNGCILAGIATAVDCGFTQTATAQDGTGMGSRVTGSIDVTCGVYQFNTKICHLEGTVTGGTGYLNGTPGVLNGPTTSALTMTNGAAGSCPLGNGDKGHVSPLTWTVTSANSPTITRTA